LPVEATTTTTTTTTKSALKKQSCDSTLDNYIESIEKLYQIERQKSQIIITLFKPRYYLITKTKTKSIDSVHETKLDGIAVNILLSSSISKNKDEVKLDYNCLYSSLLNLLDTGMKLVEQKSSVSIEVCISDDFFKLPRS
jgi:hypothetical protein